MTGILCVSTACAAGSGDNQGGAGVGGAGGAKATTAATGATATATTGTAFMTSSTSTGIEGPAEVYGQSKDTLYKLDPVTKAVTIIGLFSGCGIAVPPGVQDIALDKDSNIFATTLTDLYTVDKNTAACTHVATGAYPNSLSFVPAGTLDPSKEALVGYVPVIVGNKTQNQYVRVDTVTGAITNIGAPWNETFISSGDIVSVINGPTYLTVKAVNAGTECKTADCLVEVNPQNGSFIKSYGLLNTYKQVFGLAFWAGSVYGFDNAGDLFEVKVQGNTNITTAITITPPLLGFWGAGSTTSAPPVPN